MNKERREWMQGIVERLDDIETEVESILQEEQKYRDSIPENLRYSKKYMDANDNCEKLESALDNMHELIVKIEEAQR